MATKTHQSDLPGFTLFAIVDQQFNEVVEHEISDTLHRQELRAEFIGRRKDWGEGFALYEIQGCALASNCAGVVIPADCRLMRRTVLPEGLRREQVAKA